MSKPAMAVRLFLIAAVVAVAAQAGGGGEDGHFWPCRSRLANPASLCYQKAVEALLVDRPVRHADPHVMMVVTPAFESEWLVTVSDVVEPAAGEDTSSSTRTVVEWRSATVSISELDGLEEACDRPRELEDAVAIALDRAPISKELALRIESAWAAVLLDTRYRRPGGPLRLGVDATTYRAMAIAREIGGDVCGETPSWRLQEAPLLAAVVETAEILAEWARSDDAALPRHKERLEAALTRLEESSARR